MSFSRLAHTSAAYPSIDAGVTTSGIDTTGAKLIVAMISGLNGTATFSDSKGNTWTRDSFAFVPQVYWCFNPITDAAHTFAVAGTGEFATVGVVAYSCTGTPTLDQSNHHTTTGPTASISPGSVTPTTTNQVLVGCYWDLGAYSSIDSGFTTLESHDHTSGQKVGLVLADLIETSIVAQNPTVTMAASTAFNTSGMVFTFKEGTAGISGGILRRRRR